ncbi:DUF2306 domain-containing protein [Allorhodopirellula solitaria]|uniref:DUF2306 domain-containing protein n=1 Tax=Allorhodopirellula solitaria TaxID=2527987 RepID=A0A5C5WLI5_9BACT|nr:hypothetical protein CA85_52610 [Allorhodopirellula solitaria]
MSYENLMVAHLVTVVPCIFLGLVIFALPKGNRLHRTIGRAYVILMLLTSILSLFMKARAGPQLMGHFGFIHLFSVLTVVSLPAAVFAARAGEIKTHKYMMMLAYMGAIGFAGLLTLLPDRYFHRILFSN